MFLPFSEHTISFGPVDCVFSAAERRMTENGALGKDEDPNDHCIF